MSISDIFDYGMVLVFAYWLVLTLRTKSGGGFFDRELSYGQGLWINITGLLLSIVWLCIKKGIIIF